MLKCDIEEFTQRCRALNLEEQKIVVKTLPSEILISEVSRRLTNFDAVVEHINATAKGINGGLMYGK